MAINVREDIIEAAMALRGAAPDEWTMMLEAVKDYSWDQLAKMADCPPDMLPRAQGMAIAMRELTHLFTDAPQLHQKMQEKKRHG
jgi:hypothetical protein